MSEFLYGRRAVNEALIAGSRSFKRLFLDQGGEEGGDFIREIHDRAVARGIRIEVVSRNRLGEMVGAINHQGVVLEAGPYRFRDLDDILTVPAERGEAPFFLLLDLLQDVQNVGTLIRTAEAVGIHGIIMQERRAASITPAVVNASSGASEHMAIAQVTNLVIAMKTLKEADIWLAGLDRGPDSIRYDQANLAGALGLVVGSEGKGMRRLVRETCDFVISMPMRGRIESLNAAVAGSIALYAALRVRQG